MKKATQDTRTPGAGSAEVVRRTGRCQPYGMQRTLRRGNVPGTGIYGAAGNVLRFYP